MKAKRKVLFAAFEATPFIKTGGLGDVAGSLPAALCDGETEVRVVLPKLGTLREDGFYFVLLNDDTTIYLMAQDALTPFLELLR